MRSQAKITDPVVQGEVLEPVGTRLFELNTRAVAAVVVARKTLENRD